MSESVALDLSGIGVVVTGLDTELADRFRSEWAPFLAEPSAETFLRMTVGWREGEYREPDYRPKTMRADLTESGARFRMAEGTVEVGNDGEARAELLRGLGERTFYTVENFLRACLAWRLPSRGGGLVHAAGLELDGRAFLMVGPAGSGKSSWAAQGAAAGGRVISDDLVLIDGGSGGIEAVGSPFRSSYKAPYLPGRWPVAAILFPRQGKRARLAPAAALLAQARLTANLPFVTEGLEHDARIEAVVRRVLDRVPCAELTFALDPSFVELLRGWPGGPE